MDQSIEIGPVAETEFEGLLPMIEDYQRFYEVTDIDRDRNRAFFARFLEPSDDGLLLAARESGEILGYACLYWHFSSLLAVESVLMNDLFVAEAARGKGIGRGLIKASERIARDRGAKVLEWTTAIDNETAQRLYDTTGANRETWIGYELDL